MPRARAPKGYRLVKDKDPVIALCWLWSEGDGWGRVEDGMPWHDELIFARPVPRPAARKRRSK